VDRLDGRPPLAIGRDNQSLYYPTFQQDGKAVRHLLRGPAGIDDIQDIGLIDGSVSSIPTNIKLIQPSFSFDGQSVAFHSEEPKHQVWKMDIASRKITQLTFGPDAHGFANFSRDGAWLQVQRIKGANADVWVLPSAGGKLEPVIEQPGKWYAGGWSADGKEILVAGNQGNGWALFAVERQSRKLHRITPDLPLRMYLRYPRLSPDGVRLAYEFHESKGNVFIAGIAK
jgi:Tol biopolymer transport system component